jgi:hypothetical protein
MLFIEVPEKRGVAGIDTLYESLFRPVESPLDPA